MHTNLFLSSVSVLRANESTLSTSADVTGDRIQEIGLHFAILKNGLLFIIIGVAVILIFSDIEPMAFTQVPYNIRGLSAIQH